MPRLLWYPTLRRPLLRVLRSIHQRGSGNGRSNDDWQCLPVLNWVSLTAGGKLYTDLTMVCGN